ncbi:unnamed protein product [Pleuronectes platessa]|uniref:Uncharacterized protein n=1 Tax=Pleuronectes platessa TaxID=8262 RepID=A0A9N7V186_PLEPL|nr:unnamed protein product [Pleuronectes platessa]
MGILWERWLVVTGPGRKGTSTESGLLPAQLSQLEELEKPSEVGRESEGVGERDEERADCPPGNARCDYSRDPPDPSWGRGQADTLPPEATAAAVIEIDTRGLQQLAYALVASVDGQMRRHWVIGDLCLVCGGRLQPALCGAQLGSALVLVLADRQGPAAQAQLQDGQ